MNGIYIHIPFCKKVCYYCDFHFTVSLKQKDAIIDSILKELEIRKDYLGNKVISTVYFGGGTPSILSLSELDGILQKISSLFTIEQTAEITLEANPDDLNEEYLVDLKRLGINRLSIGVQSFFDEDLTWMNRRHNVNEAENCIKLSQDKGFSNLNIDLIYGLPQMTVERWQQNLHTFISLDVPHLSAYHLTIEPKTVFGYYKRKGRLTEVDEEISLKHYDILVDTMSTNNFEHYEISNFCKDGRYSRHNTNYWKAGHYLGIGPSAHSFNGTSRQWNVSVNSDYINAIAKGEAFYEVEKLSENEKFNDYLLTGLRTQWGIDLSYIKKAFGDQYFNYLEKVLSGIIDNKTVKRDQDIVRLTDRGMFLSDNIIAGLFMV
jgi:putative oxygen-independent coproporphyrinogen III oxidase